MTRDERYRRRFSIFACEAVIAAFAATALPSQLKAAEDSSELSQYLNETFKNSNYKYSSASNGMAYGFESTAGSGTARIFVLARDSNGRFFVEEQSQEFEFDDPRGLTSVEAVEAAGPDRFSVQINYRTLCGPSIDIYRFKKVGANWRESGHDYSTMACNDDGSIGNDERISENMLTGRVIQEVYKNDKRVKYKISRQSFATVLLRDFSPN